MSGYYNPSDPDDEFDSGSNGSGSGLRKQLEELLAENKRLSRLLEGDRQKAATELLKGKGIDPAVLELAPKDADPVEWVEKYSYLLGGKETQEVEPESVAPEIEVPQNEDPAVTAEREARAQMAEAASSGSTSQSSVVSTDLMEKLEKFGPDATEEELIRFFRSNGMG